MISHRLLAGCSLLLSFSSLQSLEPLYGEIAPVPVPKEVSQPALKETPPEDATATLIEKDLELKKTANAASQKKRGDLFKQLAVQKNPQARFYLRGVFESETELRDEVASAIAFSILLGERKQQPDWRFLLRSLPTLESKQLPEVFQALTRFREKSTKAEWRREVLLRSADLPEKNLPDAFRLLEHWTGQIFQ